MDIPVSHPIDDEQHPKKDGISEPSTEHHEHKATYNSGNENNVSTVASGHTDLLTHDQETIQDVHGTYDLNVSLAMDSSSGTCHNFNIISTNVASKPSNNLFSNIGGNTATKTDCSNLPHNLCVPRDINSVHQSQVVFVDSGIIDGQDVTIPLSSACDRIDVSHSTNSLLLCSNQFHQTESMIIDSGERHIPLTSNLISPVDLSVSTSTHKFPSQITITSNQLIKQSVVLPSTSQIDNTGYNNLRNDSILSHNEDLPTNCQLTSIDKKLSEIEATINIMEKKLPSSSSRIVFEQNIFPSISQENDDSNDWNARLNSNQETMNSNLLEAGSNATDDNQSVTMWSDWVKEKKVDIFTQDSGPKMYDATGKLVTPPFIPKKLTEAFSRLPIFGRPNTKAELGEFQIDKIRHFVGCGLNNQEFEALMDYCSPEHLRTGKELTMDTINPGQGFFPMDKNLLEATNQEPELSLHRRHRLRIDRDIKNNYIKRMKYRGIRMIPLNQEDDDTYSQVSIGEPLQPGHDLLFRVRVYRPFKYSPIDKYLTRTRHSVFSNDIVLLGRNKLNTLRDRIMCCNDVDMRVDVSETPDDLPPTTAKDVFPSGFLFINNVFYVDTRKGCFDYSAPIRRWAAKNGIGDFTSKDMCNVRLDELVIKLGHPEVYVHQGSCEHLFMFSEVRVLGAADPLQLCQYPRHTALSQNQTVYCTTCAEFAAKWIVVGCAGVPFDPAFFCDKCFKLYLYKDGTKIGEFKAYLYRGNEIK